MILMLKLCQNTGIPMHGSQRLLPESAESEAGILMGTDFLCEVFKPSCLQMQKDWERKLSISLLQKNAPHLALCVCAHTHVCLLWLIHF